MKIVLEGSEDQRIAVVGTAQNGREAIELVEQHSPDVVLMDVRMPVMNGVDATREIHRRHPHIKILMLTTFQDDDLVQSALGSGAIGYVLKEVQPDELIESIKAVHQGFFLVSQSVATRLVEKAAHGSGGDVQHSTGLRRVVAAFPEIGRRESEVLYYVSQSWNNAEIARELFLAEQTVKNYITAIYAKIGARDRLHCVRIVSDRIGDASK